MRRFVPLLGLLLPASAAAQGSTVLDSYARARTLLDSAVLAHGGLTALTGARQISVRFAGQDVARNQSRKVAAPFDTVPARAELKIDLARNRLSWHSWTGYPGGIRRAGGFQSDSTRHYRVEHGDRTWYRAQYPPADQQLGNLFYVPQFVLLAARENLSALRYLGRMNLSDGSPVDIIATGIFNGRASIALDPASRVLRGFINLSSDPLMGDVTQEVIFSTYRTLNGVFLPTRRTSRTAGQVTRDLEYVAATPNYSMPEAEAGPPASYREVVVPGQPEPLKSLAPGVWVLTHAGYSVLVVAQRDYLVVVDAPSSFDQAVLGRIRALDPGKPIRHVIPTHHHDDHSGGVRQFAQAGATIVTTPGNREYFERMAAARTTVVPDIPPLVGRPPIETITAKRVFADGGPTLEIHDLGPSPHAEEMLVAWLPQHGILFQGDLIDISHAGTVSAGMNNETTVHFAGWLKEQGWNVRVFAGTHGILRDVSGFEEILRQPVN